jgi:hypothetical protein
MPLEDRPHSLSSGKAVMATGISGPLEQEQMAQPRGSNTPNWASPSSPPSSARRPRRQRHCCQFKFEQQLERGTVRRVEVDSWRDSVRGQNQELHRNSSPSSTQRLNVLRTQVRVAKTRAPNIDCLSGRHKTTFIHIHIHTPLLLLTRVQLYSGIASSNHCFLFHPQRLPTRSPRS